MVNTQYITLVPHKSLMHHGSHSHFFDNFYLMFSTSAGKDFENYCSVKIIGRFFQNCEAFSEYLNFNLPSVMSVLSKVCGLSGCKVAVSKDKEELRSAAAPEAAE